MWTRKRPGMVCGPTQLLLKMHSYSPKDRRFLQEENAICMRNQRRRYNSGDNSVIQNKGMYIFRVMDKSAYINPSRSNRRFISTNANSLLRREAIHVTPEFSHWSSSVPRHLRVFLLVRGSVLGTRANSLARCLSLVPFFFSLFSTSTSTSNLSQVVRSYLVGDTLRIWWAAKI